MKKHCILVLGFLLLFYGSFAQKTFKMENDELKAIKRELTDIKRANGEFPEAYKKGTAQFATEDYGEAPDWGWVENFGGSGRDITRGIAVATDGTIYTTGSFSGEMSIGTSNYNSVSRRDAFLAKFQSDGTLIWFKQFSPLPGERIDAFGIHLNGADIYFTGYYSGDVNFGGIELPGTHDKNLFFVRTNTDGEVGMAINHPTSNEQEIGLKVDTDNNGNIFVLGSTDGTTNRKHPSVVIKLATDGSVLLDYYHDQSFCDMYVKGESIYFLGTVNSPDSIGDFYLEPVRFDAFIAKSNTNMAFDWVEMASHNSPSGASYGIALYVSADEELFFTVFNQYSDIIWGGIELEGAGGIYAKCYNVGTFSWLNKANGTPTDITANEDYVYLSTSFKDLDNPVLFHKINLYFTASGGVGPDTYVDYQVGTIAIGSTDNSLIVTQNADELIQLAKMEDYSFDFDWVLLFGGDAASSHPIGMDIDEIGFQYHFGYTANEIDYFGQTVGKGLFLAKQGYGGAPVWVVQFPNADYIPSKSGTYIFVSTSSVYLTGTFYNPLVIPGGPTLTPDIWGSTYLIKYDLDGNYQWSVKEDFTSEGNLCLAVDASGNILLSGTFLNAMTIGTTTLVSAGINDAFVAKYDGSGTFLWAKRAGGEDLEWSAFISADGQDNVYLTGEFGSYEVTVDYYPITLNEGDGNILIAKFDPEGNALWATAKGGSTVKPYSDYYGWPTGIYSDAEGSFYLKGWHYDSAYFDNILLSSRFNNPEYNNRWNKFVAKFDTDGNTLWASTISELSYSWDFNQFDVDTEGNVYTGLKIRGDTTLFGEDFMYLKSGLNDFVIARYTNEGELDWVKSITGSQTGSCWLSSVAASDPATTYVSGWFNDYLDFGTTSFVVNNKNGFIGLLEKSNSVIVYQRDELPFEVYPNPARQTTHILLKETASDETGIRLTDIHGKTVYSKRFASGQQTLELDVSGFSAGVYIVHLKSAKGSGVTKLVVE